MRRLLCALVALAAPTRAYQDPNATAQLKYLQNHCVAAPCSAHGPCAPRFARAQPGATVARGTAWVITVKRVRRATQSDWANMEHFAATTLPQYEELWRGRTGVDYVVLPQVAAASNFASARGADTDWFKETARVAFAALRARANLPPAPPGDGFLVFRDGLGRSTCYERVVHATYVPRATYLRDPDATRAFLEAADGLHGGGSVADAAPSTRPPRTVTLLLRSANLNRPAKRAGPAWANSRELAASLERWLSAEHPGWALQTVALAHAFSFASQFRTAQHSGVLVGAHGASLTNGVFQRDGAALLEVLNCGHRSNTYRKLATNRGLFYASATKAGQGPGGADCGRDLGRRHVDTRRSLPLEELRGPLSAAIAAVEATLPPATLAGCASLLPAAGDRSVGDVDGLAAALERSDARGDERRRLGECAAYRAGTLFATHVALGGDDGADVAAHRRRRTFLLAAAAFDRKGGGLVDSWAMSFFVDSAAVALVEAQRLARHVLFLHVSKAAGTSFCKLAARNKCAAPPKFSTMWDPGDGPTWGNCARGLKVVHESAAKIGKGRRARCSAKELDCAQRLAAFKTRGYELMAVERWADAGGAVCPSPASNKEALWYATVLREPLARVASHHNHLWTKTLRTAPKAVKGRTRSSRKPGLYFQGVFEERGPAPCVDPEELPFSVGAPHRTGYDWSMVCAMSSDYATRSLLGTSFSDRPYDARVPPRESRDALLRRAKDALLDFAVVLVVEQASRARNVVRHGLGWRPFSKADVFPTIGRDASKSRKVVAANVTGSDRALLTQHNQLDLALYAFANDLFDADVFFYDKAAHSGLFREPIADARRLFCGFNKAPPPVDEAAGDDEADGYGEDPPVR